MGLQRCSSARSVGLQRCSPARSGPHGPVPSHRPRQGALPEPPLRGSRPRSRGGATAAGRAGRSRRLRQKGLPAALAAGAVNTHPSVTARPRPHCPTSVFTHSLRPTPRTERVSSVSCLTSLCALRFLRMPTKNPGYSQTAHVNIFLKENNLKCAGVTKLPSTHKKTFCPNSHCQQSTEPRKLRA